VGAQVGGEVADAEPAVGLRQVGVGWNGGRRAVAFAPRPVLGEQRRGVLLCLIVEGEEKVGVGSVEARVDLQSATVVFCRLVYLALGVEIDAEPVPELCLRRVEECGLAAMVYRLLFVADQVEGPREVGVGLPVAWEAFDGDPETGGRLVESAQMGKGLPESSPQVGIAWEFGAQGGEGLRRGRVVSLTDEIEGLGFAPLVAREMLGDGVGEFSGDGEVAAIQRMGSP